MSPDDVIVAGVIFVVLAFCFGMCYAYFNKDRHDCGVGK